MEFPPIHIGLETEIGIASDAPGEDDVVAQSIALVRSASLGGVSMRWDYSAEDPHVDMRGFRVHELRQDTDESNYFAEDAERELSYVEIKSDLVLGNGARFYNDHAHPEYCTPECTLYDDVATHDRAGERILMGCARHLEASTGHKVRLYKNNTDFDGHSYGCHENYLIPRSIEWNTLAGAIQAFLVTRQIYAGAGKFAFEAEDRFLRPGFQISQRSDFFSELQSVDTMQRRPIINTRDEPHANPKRFRRFHVILGDANMSPFATWLKVGATAMVLESILRQPGRDWPVLADPLRALRDISADTSLREPVELENGESSTALEIQSRYLQAAESLCEKHSTQSQELLAEWVRILDDLATDASRCKDRLDWVAKRELVRKFQAQQGLGEVDPWLQSLDLEYHRLDPEEGLYYGLEQASPMARVPQDPAVQRAMHHPPETRAMVRGLLIQKFAGQVVAAQWDHVTLRDDYGQLKVSLMDLFSEADLSRAVALVNAARSPNDLRNSALVAH